MSNIKDNSFNHLLSHAAKSYVDTFDEKNKTADLKLALTIIGILAFVGYEAVKVLYRKNFGMTTGSFIRLGICFLCFGGIAAISFSCMNSDSSFATESGTSDSHLVVGIIYSVLAFTVLIKGIVSRNRKDNFTSGYSNVLGFLLKEGWSESLVQNLAEPLLTLSIGIAVCMFDLLGGVPLIFCAISTWANLAFEKFFPDNSLKAKVNQLNANSKSVSALHEINTD